MEQSVDWEWVQFSHKNFRIVVAMLRDVRVVEFKERSSESEEENEEERNQRNSEMDYRAEIGKPVIVMICGTLIYYHCAYRNSTLLTLVSDVLIVLLCSFAILGLLFRQINISVPVDPLEWQISQDTANNIVACMANTIGAAESVLRVAATGHDKRLFLKVVVCLYLLSVLGRAASGVTVAFAGLWLFCLYMFVENCQTVSACLSWFTRRKDGTNVPQD